MNWDAKKVRYLWNLRKQHYGSAKVVTKSQRAPQKTIGDVLPICLSILSEADMFKMLYLYYIYEFLQQKSQRYQPYNKAGVHFFFRCGFFCPALSDTPTLCSKKPSSWSDFSLLASAKRIEAWPPVRGRIFPEGGRLNCQEGWLKSNNLTFTYNSGLPFFGGSCFLRWKLLSEENCMNWILRSSQIKYIHLPNHSNDILNFLVLSNMTVPEVGRWIYAKKTGSKAVPCSNF